MEVGRSEWEALMRGGYKSVVTSPANGLHNEPTSGLGTNAGRSGVQLVAISDLRPADSPRLNGQDPDHVRILAESRDKLPPIVAHRETGRVIDGMHRLRAAMLRGAQSVPVVYVDDVSEADLFVLSVRANMSHGLPLTSADRRAAAERILALHPGWSDRVIGEVTGLSDKTIRSLRTLLRIDSPQTDSRLGMDGRVRPVSGLAGRRHASKLISANPRASLRQIAREAGVSVGTAHDVRKRLMSGQSAATPRSVAGAKDSCAARNTELEPIGRRVSAEPPPEQVLAQDPTVIIRKLAKDPSVRYTDSGRLLLRWLSSRKICVDELAEITETIPPHCRTTVAAYARRIAETWTRFASELEHHELTSHNDSVTRGRS
jgi:ParB-like chromosome segregation protein Spo0J